MNEVKMVFFVLPFTFEILNNELNIRGHPLGLNRADIISNDMGAREFPFFPAQISLAGQRGLDDE